MTRRSLLRRVVILSAGWVALGGAVTYVRAAGPQQPSPSTVAASFSPADGRELLDQYCVTCHSDIRQEGGLVPVSLQTTDVANVGAQADVWETVVRKLRAGVMPPARRPRPDAATHDGFVSWLETELDRVAATRVNPGRPEAVHRLNRAEYHNAVRDLLAFDVDVTALLPADDASYGFDNIAGVLRFSPTLMERYLSAAKKISRAATGSPPPFPNFDVFRLADDLPQDDLMEGLPFGTRGGTRIRYHFPVDGEYVVRVKLARQVGAGDRHISRFHQPQQLELSVDGERLQMFTLAASVPAPPDRRRTVEDRSRLDEEWEVRFRAQAGPRDITVTFVNRPSALLETWVQPFLNPFPPGGNCCWSSRRGAYLGRVEVSGPFEVEGPGDTPSRRRIFMCHPASPSEAPACARTILSTLARRAYRRPVTDADLEGLLGMYDEGRTTGGFEAGIEFALRRLLVSPEFLFRTEVDPPGLAPDTNYRLGDLELASRLSFFLWSSIPDDELLAVAEQGQLSDPVVLERQVRRMLADPRSRMLVENFAGQWLLLRNVPALRPDPYKDPDFDESLRQALRRETELFFEHIMREDRSVFELLTANYTFLNERLARHYGIPHVNGSRFRRVALPEGSVRRGLLGHGSILAVTSQANRTSPVVRGKWLLENVLGTPPPAPPPNVPALEEPHGGGQALTMRERMEQHRSNPVCAACHMMMDPLGLSLENFDQAGRWRAVETSFDSRVATFASIDASGTMPDGTTFDGATGLREALLSRSDTFIATLTEKLLTYALGRGVEYYDMPTVRAIVRDADRDGHRFSSLVLGIVNSPSFQMRRSMSAESSSTVASRR